MKALFKALLLLFVVVILTACGGVPVKPETKTTTVAAGGNCVLPYRPIGRYETAPDPVSIVPIFRECRALQPLIEWSKRASRHETYRGGCQIDHHSIRCSSVTPLSGYSPDKKSGSISGEVPFSILATFARLDNCEGYPSIRREVTFRVEWDSGMVPRMKYEAAYECYR